jgi:UDP-glucose 4-epimerase
MLRHIAADTGLEIVILRPPLIYGPGVKANLLSLLKAVDRGWPLPLGAVKNRRSLIGIDNFCEAIRLALTRPACGREGAWQKDDCSTLDGVTSDR